MSSEANISLHLIGPGDRALLERLLQLYLYEFSLIADPDIEPGDIGDDGTYPYGDDDRNLLDQYFDASPSFGYLLKRNGVLAGFALINEWTPTGLPADFVVSEFFILHKYHRTGLGHLFAHELFQRHKGQWELGVIEDNKRALAFWQSVLDTGPVTTVEKIKTAPTQWHAGTAFRFRSD